MRVVLEGDGEASKESCAERAVDARVRMTRGRETGKNMEVKGRVSQTREVTEERGLVAQRSRDRV